MRIWYLAAAFLAVTLFPPARAAAQPTEGKPGLAANAALKYWEAFALMPALGKDDPLAREDWQTVPLEGPVLKLIKASENSREYLHRGARLPRCDWSLDYSDGIYLRLPHLAKARELSRLAVLHARHEFAQGHWQAGVEDSAATLALARHIACRDDAGNDPTLIALLVRYAIEAVAIEVGLAPDLPKLDAASLKTLSKRLETLPAGATVAQSIRAEKKTYIVDWLLKQMHEAEKKKPGSWRDVFVFSEAEASTGPKILKTIETYEKAVQLAEDLRPRYDEMARLAALPKAEFEAQFPKFAEQARTNPLADLVLPAVQKVVAAEHRNQAKLAMLKAAIAIVQHGPDAVKDFKDPFGTGPFAYRALEPGFELRSQLISHGQPVILVVGQRKK